MAVRRSRVASPYGTSLRSPRATAATARSRFAACGRLFQATVFATSSDGGKRGKRGSKGSKAPETLTARSLTKKPATVNGPQPELESVSWNWSHNGETSEPMRRFSRRLVAMSKLEGVFQVGQTSW